MKINLPFFLASVSIALTACGGGGGDDSGGTQVLATSAVSAEAAAGSQQLSRRRAVVRSQYLLSASEAGDVPSLHQCSDRWRQQAVHLRPDATAEGFLAAFPTRDAASRSKIAAELHRQGF